MVDISDTIVPKSDQLNADDLIAGPRTITITKVVKKNDVKQPVWISFEGDDGKPWKPCLSTRRVLVKLWGSESDAYIGRSVTLYSDPSVTYGGSEVGGIRISHMTDIGDGEGVLLTSKRGKRELCRIKRLETPQAKPAGDIGGARVMLEGADAETVGAILAGLRDRTWTKEETAEIKRLAAEAKERKA